MTDLTQALISMNGTLKTKDNQYWEDYLPTLVHVYNCARNHATDFILYYVM